MWDTMQKENNYSHTKQIGIIKRSSKEKSFNIRSMTYYIQNLCKYFKTKYEFRRCMSLITLHKYEIDNTLKRQNSFR